jgi:uncharacterized protein
MTIQDYLNVEGTIISLMRAQLKPYLKYHCVEHTHRVIHKAIEIGTYEKLNAHDLILVQLAALFHDAGFLMEEENHEKSSCKIARQYLAPYNLSTEDQEKICGMIMSTNIPQVANNILEMVVADADLEYLGTDDYGEISTRLLEEIRHKNPSFSDFDWLKLQIYFLESHHFFTEYAREKLIPIKKNNLSRLKSELLRLK